MPLDLPHTKAQLQELHARELDGNARMYLARAIENVQPHSIRFLLSHVRLALLFATNAKMDLEALKEHIIQKLSEERHCDDDHTFTIHA